MVDRVGGGAGPSTPGNKAEKSLGRKREVKVSGKVGVHIESRLREILKESNSSESRPDLLLSGLVDAIFADKQLNFEDKERILLLVKDKISKHSHLAAVFNTLLNQLANQAKL